MTADIRLKIAEQIVSMFQKKKEVTRAFLRGSLADNTADRYSDIDIGVDVSGHDNGAFVSTIISVMQNNCTVHFHDIPRSLLPESYICTFYLEGLSVFWNVDIQCLAKPHYRTLTSDMVRNDAFTHALRSWILDAKCLIRASEAAEANIRRHVARVLTIENQSNLALEELMKLTLDELCRQAGGRFSDMFRECYDVCEMIAEGAT